jgi:putative transposase
MMYPLVLDLAADKIPVAVTCRVLGFTTQAFYKWRKNPVTQRDFDDARLIDAALDVHADDPTCGYRFIADELAVAGFAAGENRVARLCSQERIWSIHAKKRGLNRKAGPPVLDDHVRRVFTAAAPNLVWLTDITEHATSEGKLYLCAELGPAFQPDRRLLDRLADEGVPGGVGAAERGRLAGPGSWADRALRSRQPVPVHEIRPGLEGPPVARVDGQSRSLRRQRRDGVLLRPAAEERPRPATLDHQTRATPGIT